MFTLVQVTRENCPSITLQVSKVVLFTRVDVTVTELVCALKAEYWKRQRVNVKPSRSVRIVFVELFAVVTVLWNTQSVTVHQPKQVVREIGDIPRAVVGLLPTPTFVSITAVATSEILRISTTPELVIDTEYACAKIGYQPKLALSILIAHPQPVVKS